MGDQIQYSRHGSFARHLRVRVACLDHDVPFKEVGGPASGRASFVSTCVDLTQVGGHLAILLENGLKNLREEASGHLEDDSPA